MPIRLRLRRDRRRARGDGRPGAGPLRELDRGRGHRHPRHARVRRRRPRPGRRVRPADPPLPDRQGGAVLWSGSRWSSPTHRRARSAPASSARTCRRPRCGPPPAPPRRCGRWPSPTGPGPRSAPSPRRGSTAPPCCEQGVEDETDNITRFVWVAREGTQPVGLGAVADLAGLLRARRGPPGCPGGGSPGLLGRDVNLTRIESRPLRRGLGRYQFFLDIEGAAGR